MIHTQRMSAALEGDFVLFLIGMRINKPLLAHKWLPVMRAMPSMIAELTRQPQRGLLHAEMWFGRTTLMMQYWRSLDQLLAYAADRHSRHLPAWRDFNRRIGTDGSVGIWHETYCVSAGRYENIYVNMPPFGLGRAGELTPVGPGRHSARQRLHPEPEQ